MTMDELEYANMNINRRTKASSQEYEDPFDTKFKEFRKELSMNKPHNIDKVLEERGKRYGKFTGHAKITQELKKAMRFHTNWEALEPDQKEALEMVAHKVGRILNGDPNYLDSWDDIIGYVKLVTDRLRGNEK